MIEDITKVKITKIKKIYNVLKDNNIEETSFEFVIGSLFPKVYENIKEELRRQYTLGYAAGLEMRNKKNKSNKNKSKKNKNKSNKNNKTPN